VPVIYSPNLTPVHSGVLVTAATYSASDGQIIRADCTSNNITITVPNNAMATVVIKRIDSSANTLTVVASSGLIDGDANATMNGAQVAATFIGDGTNVEISSVYGTSTGTALPFTWKGAWTNNTSYLAGDVVYYTSTSNGRVLYQALNSITAAVLPATNKNPLSDTANWLPLSYNAPTRMAETEWSYPTLQNSWVNYDNGWSYPPARYRQDRYGKMRLSGLIAGGTSTLTIMSVPSNLAPENAMLFTVAANGGTAQITVLPSGAIYCSSYTNGGTNAYVSLEEISWFPAGTITWTYPTLLNSWVNYSASSYGQARYYIDPDGVVHWDGLIASGAITSSIATLPTAAATDGSSEQMWASGCAAGVARIDVTTTNVFVSAYSTSGNNGYLSLTQLEYPGAGHSLTWHTCSTAYLNSWVSYGAPFSAARFCKSPSGLVYWDGLIKLGTSGGGSPMTGPVPPGFRGGYGSQIYMSIAGNFAARVDALYASGSIALIAFLVTGGTNGFVSLNNVRYLAEG
jgi:hypothetical protein